MKGITKVKVYIKWEDNKIVHICTQENCECKDKVNCEPDVVTHDKYKGIKECFKQDRYGK